MMALVGCLAYEFQVVLPIVASETFAGDARDLRFPDRGDGRGRGGRRALRGRAGTHRDAGRWWSGPSRSGWRCSLVALSPTLLVALLGMGLVGAASVAFLSTGNSTLQLAAAPHMRGRVMALWAVAFLGSTPDRRPDRRAWSARHFGGRAGLVLGAVACLVAAGSGGDRTSARESAARAAEVVG